MFVKFIAHAGICIKEGDVSLLIDPWFTDSTLKNPFVESVSGSKTIDFQVPKTNEFPSNYTPRAILLSHFHAHHAPLHDIAELVSGSKEVVVAFPECTGSETVERTVSCMGNVSALPIRDNESFSIGSLKITGITHTALGHLAWLVESPSGKILHIADAKMNRMYNVSTQDEVWNKYIGMKPDLVFISAGGNSKCVGGEKIEERDINESTGLTAIQGAKLLKLIQPKAVCLIGMYNHSVWRGRQEFIPNAFYTEEEFGWATTWLTPHIKFIRLSPGHTFGIGDATLGTHVDTYIV